MRTPALSQDFALNKVCLLVQQLFYNLVML